jgi:2-polyprenyl-3-methyl-5-hydroxy-6-metoxy-1,4-benzoquinol methylase
MDDQIFDKKSALDWIRTIESDAARVRESDIYPKIKNWIKEFSLTEILDIGCGQGVCSEKLSLSSCKYIGIDPSPFLIERAINLYSASERTFLCPILTNTSQQIPTLLLPSQS